VLKGKGKQVIEEPMEKKVEAPSKKKGGKQMAKPEPVASKSKILKVSENSKAIKKQRGRKSKDGLTLA